MKLLVSRLETEVSPVWNKSFQGLKLEFHRWETIVSDCWNQSFRPLKLSLPLHRTRHASPEKQSYPIPSCDSNICHHIAVTPCCHTL